MASRKELQHHIKENKSLLKHLPYYEKKSWDLYIRSLIV